MFVECSLHFCCGFPPTSSSQCASSMILQSLFQIRGLTLGWSPRFWLFSLLYTQWTSCRQSWLLDGGCHLGGPKAVKTSYWMDGPSDMVVVSRTKKKEISCSYQLSNRSLEWNVSLCLDFLLGQNSRNLEAMLGRGDVIYFPNRFFLHSIKNSN